jgi:hypothetical protein
MNIAELERFYEKITLQAVADTVAKLLTYPFGFHGDTGMRDYLYAKLHQHRDEDLESNDPKRRPSFSTLLLQSEHYTLHQYGSTGQTGGGRFDLALVLPPESPEIEARFAEKLACSHIRTWKEHREGHRLGMVDRSASETATTSDISKLYHDLRSTTSDRDGQSSSTIPG